MNIRSALRAGASRFAHLSSIPLAKKAEGTEDEEARKKADEEAKAKEADEGAKATAKSNEEDEDDDEMDEEECKKAETAGHGAALKAARRQSARAQKTRFAAIFGSEHATGRIPLACELFMSSMKSEDAVRVLSAAQPESSNPLARALAETPAHRIGESDPNPARSQTPGARLMGAMTRLVKGNTADPVDRLAASLAEKLRG